MSLENIDTDPYLKEAEDYVSTSLQDAVKLRIGKEGVAAERPLTIPKHFQQRCAQFLDRPALTFENPKYEGDSSRDIVTYKECEEKVHQAALMLLHVGLEPRTSVGILSLNCPEWLYSEFGALKAGGVVAGIYPTNSAEAVFHVLDTSDATICVVGDANQMLKLREIQTRLPKLKAVIQIHGPFDDFVGIDEGYYRWQDLENMEFRSELEEELKNRENQVKPNECALLIYTSGTIGMPKAVMLSHDSTIINSKAMSSSLSDIKQGYESSVSYLPLNHIAAQVFEIFLMIENGGCIHFADRNALKGSLGKTLSNVRPTRIFGVPRIFEKLQEALTTQSEHFPFFYKYIFEKSRGILEDYHLNSAKGKSSHIKFWLASKVLQQMHATMGLDSAKSLFIGGAPVTEELKRYYLSINLPLCDVYGLSEAGGSVCFNFEPKRLESTGKAIDGTELRIDNPDTNGQGEICVRSRSCLMGYLNNLETTKATLSEDGFFRTGDVGYIDPKGRLMVSGRIKELVITSGGENIPPVRVEELIKRELHGVSNVLLVGDHRKYLTVLLTLKTEMDLATGLPLDKLRPETIEWLQSLGLDYTLLSKVLNIPGDLSSVDVSTLVTKPPQKLRQVIQEGIKRANSHAISNAQKVQKFTILPHDFSLATGELGPTLKVLRSSVIQKYNTYIESMYKE